MQGRANKGTIKEGAGEVLCQRNTVTKATGWGKSSTRGTRKKWFWPDDSS